MSEELRLEEEEYEGVELEEEDFDVLEFEGEISLDGWDLVDDVEDFEFINE